MLMLSMTVVDYVLYNFLHFDLEFEVPIPAAMKIIILIIVNTL